MCPRVLSGRESNLRKRAELAYREYRAILILTGRLTGEERQRIDHSLENLQRFSRSRLKAEYGKILTTLKEIRRTLGAKAGLKDYEDLLSYQTDKPPQGLLFIPKYLLEQDYFSRYKRANPVFASLPPHARIGVDVLGTLPSTGRETRWRLLEATLFEDMAVLWNATLDAETQKAQDDSKMSTKCLHALERATVRSAFHFLEGYLNGIASDVCVTTKTDELTEDERRKLTEWDSGRNRPTPLSLRDKLLQYPKIALRQAHPPVQENNCPEMKDLLEKEQSLRHALVHPTSRVDTWTESDLREHVFFTLTVSEVATVVDTVIALVRKLEDVLGHRFGDANLWLQDHDATGRFPKSVFE